MAAATELGKGQPDASATDHALAEEAERAARELSAATELDRRRAALALDEADSGDAD